MSDIRRVDMSTFMCIGSNAKEGKVLNTHRQISLFCSKFMCPHTDTVVSQFYTACRNRVLLRSSSECV